MELFSAEAMDPLLRLLASALVGALIGLDRELSDKPLGFRTLSVVSIASCALTVAAAQHDLQHASGSETLSRAVQGLMAGVGFLGGGVILHTGRRHIHGLTTAALVWLTAALGIACGLGAWRVVSAALLLGLLLLWVGGRLEAVLHRHRAPSDHASR